MAKLVSKTYGDALFMTATENGRMDEFFEAARAVEEILCTNTDFENLMSHPKITKENKARIVKETFDQRIPNEMVGLMILMVNKGRANDMQSVFAYFIDLVKEEKKIGKADVITAVKLNAAQKERVEKRLLETTRYESFEMNYQVDTSLIGGMVVRIGDRVVDSSIKSKLQDLTRELRKIQV